MIFRSIFIRYYYYLFIRMLKMAFGGPLNTKGFTTQINKGQLPNPDHITYTGTFNEIQFEMGSRTQKVADLHIGFGRASNPHSTEDNSVNQFLGIFAKGAADGAPRDKRILNSVIILDVSGSMNGGLKPSGQSVQQSNPIHAKGRRMITSRYTKAVYQKDSRLELAKQAIKMFVSKLQPDDSFGLVTFDTTAKTVISCIKKSDLEMQAAFSFINGIKANGGTNLSVGFNEGFKIMKQMTKNIKNPTQYQNRLIMLTDVEDNSVQTTDKFIQQVSTQQIHTTIIGLSSSFRSDICQKLVEIKGFNYFCAVQQEDLKKYLFQNFDWTFFPSAYDLEIVLKSDNVKYFETFGAPDAEKVKTYNNFLKKGLNEFVLSKTTTMFPSEILIQNKTIKTKGGLLLVKLGPQNSLDEFKGKIILKYTTTTNEPKTQEYDLYYKCPKNVNFYSDMCLDQAINTFYFVHEIKSLITNIKNHTEGPFPKQQYLNSFQKLKQIAPEGKVEEVQSVIKVLEKIQK